MAYPIMSKINSCGREEAYCFALSDRCEGVDEIL